MTEHVQIQSYAVSRRSFVVGSGAAAIAVAFGSLPDQALAAGPFAANAWVTIGDDGIITIMSPASEMGQGIMTTLPLLIAEDLDADWARVKIVQSPDDDKTFGNPGFFGTLTTVASEATKGYYEKVRTVGAQARKVLLANAAETLKVPVGELTTEPSMVVHAKSGRKLSYGDIAKTAKVPNPLPQATKADFKPLAQCRLIGKDIPRVDIPSKVNGTAIFGMDVALPNMLYAAMLHAPVQGEKPEKIDDAAAKAVKGIVKIVPLPMGVGIIGETVEATKKAKALLKVTWSQSAKARSYTNAGVAEDYRKLAADWSKTGVDMVKNGDADAAIAGAAKVIKADYFSDHVSHVCMEPMNATAIVKDGKVELWAPNQSPTAMHFISAAAAQTKPDNVTVHTTLLGGGFGRRTDGDEVFEVVMLAKAMDGRPVKLIWSREDDVQNDKYRPLTGQHIEIGLDAANNIVGWRHRIVNESYFARAAPHLLEKFGGKDVVSGGGGEFKYGVKAHRVEWVRDPRGVGVGAWRGIAAGYTKFAIETLIDEIAALKGVDPVAFRLELLKDDPLAAAVVKKAAEMAKWGEKRPGRGLGIAYSDSVHSDTAAVAEVSLNEATGEIRVHHIWAAIHPGIAVQPKNIVAQTEGAMVFGLGAALSEQINVKDGQVAETNFDSYRIMRMADVPPMEVAVISSDHPPTGVGEAGVPVVAPAIANAVAQLTGKRLRQLPMLPDRVKAALRSA